LNQIANGCSCKAATLPLLEKETSIIDEDDQLSSNDFSLNDEILFEARTSKLLLLLSESRRIGRLLKAAYLEEELHLSGAYNAIFIKDCTMPDGAKCEPDFKFKKIWLLKNNGKLVWNGESSNVVELVCKSGQESEDEIEKITKIEMTKPDETTFVSVELKAPSKPGIYHTEWVLSCDGFQFGPRIWCTIEVIDNKKESIESSNISIRNESTNESESIEQETEDLLVDFRSNDSTTETTTPTTSRSDNLKNTTDYELLELNSPPQSSSHSHSNSNSIKNSELRFDSDDDDFVVVPDCFDLTKKWHLTTSDDLNTIENDIQTLISTSNTSNISNDEKDQSLIDIEMFDGTNGVDETNILTPKPSLSDVIRVSPILSSSVATSTPDDSFCAIENDDDNININETTVITSNINNSEEDDDQLRQLLEWQQKSTDSKSTPKKEETKPVEISSSPISAFNLMKDAFSNLRGPLYVIL
jgi:hypothetical protein